MFRRIQTLQHSYPALAIATAALTATSLFALDRELLGGPGPKSPPIVGSGAASVTAPVAVGIAPGPQGKRVLAPTVQVFESHVVAAVRSPDLDGSGRVDGVDRDMLLANWGAANSTSDLDGDGVVDGRDLGLLLSAWSVQ